MWPVFGTAAGKSAPACGNSRHFRIECVIRRQGTGRSWKSRQIIDLLDAIAAPDGHRNRCQTSMPRAFRFYWNADCIIVTNLQNRVIRRTEVERTSGGVRKREAA
jgi:hypothetical protein